MPRLFTGLEIPAQLAESLSLLRGGLPGARWIDRENYHLTLRFIGDVGLHRKCRAAGRADARDHGLRRVVATRVVDRDRPAALRAQPRSGRADAAPTAGDEHGLRGGRAGLVHR